jgi:RNA polymerase sigma-70 factor (ECF subfamily)
LHREVVLDSAVEQVLIEQLKHGDQRALGVVYQEFSSGVFAYCLKILADRQLAEDVVQETFLKVRQNAGSLQKNESFRSWIFRIARNEALMQIRKRRQNGQIDDNTVWEENTPDLQLVNSQRAETVNRLLDSLKHEYREVLVLLVYENMSYAEIATITGATESSVKSRIFRARKTMVERLEGLV